ncbi:MAG TPA: calcium:proton antiporter, partial [Sulfurovum sp.]|nr:calcium:proton antiporter [Sulfurovum sp.]
MQILKDFSKEYSLFLAIVTYFGISYFEHTLVQSTGGNLLGFAVLFVVIM